jgi:hypothetical protein
MPSPPIDTAPQVEWLSDKAISGMKIRSQNSITVKLKEEHMKQPCHTKRSIPSESIRVREHYLEQQDEEQLANHNRPPSFACVTFLLRVERMSLCI